MTTGTPGPRSMRFSLDEVFSGMLASTEQDSFPDDAEQLAAMFEDLAGKFPLFAPMANAVDATAVTDALKKLEDRSFLEHRDGQYVLTEAGRAHSVTSKRTLFNKGDVEQLEQAAHVFDTL